MEYSIGGKPLWGVVVLVVIMCVYLDVLIIAPLLLWLEKKPWGNALMASISIVLLIAFFSAWYHIEEIRSWREQFQSAWEAGLAGGI